MAELHHLDALRPGQGLFTVDAHLPEDDLRVFAGDGVVVDHQHAHIVGMQGIVLLGPGRPFGIQQRHGHGEDRALPLFALHLNIAVHQLNDALCDGHAQAGAAEFAGGGGILLGEGVKELRQVFRAHADAGVPEGKAQGGLSVEPRRRFNHQGDRPALGREFDRVAQDVDHHLAQLHVVADIIVPDVPAGPAVILQVFVPALAADNGVHLLQHPGEGELLAFDGHAARLDPAHVQNIVDDAQQVIGGSPDPGQVLLHLFAGGRFVHGNVVQADDGVHGRADLMAHIGQEGGLCLAGLLRRGQRLRQRVILRHGFAHLFVDNRESHAHPVHQVIVPLPGMADAGHAQHLVVFRAVSSGQIAVGDDGFCFQRLPHVLRIDKAQESLPVFRIHVPPAVIRETFMVRKMDPLLGMVRIVDVRPVAHGVVLVHVHIVDAPVIGGHGRDHVVQFPLAVFLGQQLFVQRQLLLQLLLLRPGLGFRRFDPGHFRHVHAHTQQAQPSGRLPEGELGGLQVAERLTLCVRHVLKENVGLFHGHGPAVVLHKMIRRRPVKDLVIRKPHHLLGPRFPCVFREGLVAGKVFPGGNLLGKAHGGHIGQQRGNRGHQVRQFGRRLNLLRQPAVFFLRLFGVLQGLLIRPALPNLVVHVLEAHHDAGSSPGHVDFAKVDPVMPGAGLHGPDEIDGKPVPGLKPFQDIGQAHLLLHPLPVFLRDHGVHVFRLGIRVPRMAQGVADGLVVNLVHVRMVQRHLLGHHVVDQVHGVIGGGQGGNHRVPGGAVRFPLQLFIRDVGNEDHVHPAVGLCFRIVPVVVHPADGAVLPDNAVLRVIHLLFAFGDLVDNGEGDPVVILRMHHAPEGIPRQAFEFLQAAASKDIAHRLVGIDQLFRRFRPVDKEPAGHVPADLLDNGQRVLVQFKHFCLHAWTSCRLIS